MVSIKKKRKDNKNEEMPDKINKQRKKGRRRDRDMKRRIFSRQNKKNNMCHAATKGHETLLYNLSFIITYHLSSFINYHLTVSSDEKRNGSF
jgi:hypothetical protein